MPALRNVTGVLKDLHGNILPYPELTIYRGAVVGQGGAVVIPDSEVISSDGAGLVDFDLYAGNYIGYADVTDPVSGKERKIKFDIRLAEDGSADFADIVEAADVVLTPSQVAEANAARDEAEAIATAFGGVENLEAVKVAAEQAAQDAQDVATAFGGVSSLSDGYGVLALISKMGKK